MPKCEMCGSFTIKTHELGDGKYVFDCIDCEYFWMIKPDDSAQVKFKMVHDTTHFEYVIGCHFCEQRSGEL